MKKRVFAFMMAIVMLTGMTSCATGTKDGEDVANFPTKKEDSSFQPSKDCDSNYECTIDVVGVWGNFEALEQAALDFKEYYPKIEVVYSQLSDVNTDIENRMASGKGIDIYMHNWFDTNDEKKAFLWENATDLSEAGLNLEELEQNILNTGYVDGQLKMIPIYLRTYGLMVNEDLLKEHGMEIPETYEEFLACCETFKKAGIAPVLLQGNNNLVLTYNQHLIAQVMKNEKRDAIMTDALAGKDTYGVFQDSLQMMEELEEKGYVHPESNTLEDEYEGVILRFFEGDIPFVPYNSERFSGTKKREAKSESFTEHPFSYQLIPFPGESGYECVYEQLGTMYMGVYNGIEEEKKKYVIEFLSYLISEEGNKTLTQIKNMPGINKNTGFTQFPYYKNQTEDQIYVIGKDGLRLDFSEVLAELWVGYETGLTAEEYLKRAIDYKNQK